MLASDRFTYAYVLRANYNGTYKFIGDVKSSTVQAWEKVVFDIIRASRNKVVEVEYKPEAYLDAGWEFVNSLPTAYGYLITFRKPIVETVQMVLL